MAQLVAITYPDQHTAYEVRNALANLQTQYVIDVADAVVVTRDQNGKIKLDQALR